MVNNTAYHSLTYRKLERCPQRCVKICLILLFVNMVLFIGVQFHSRVDTTSITPALDDDYSRLIDIDDFEFTHLPMVCDKVNAKFIVAVHTAPGNFEKRMAVRETWGSWYKDTKVLFMIGYTEDAKTEETLRKEIGDYQDFVQGNFLDSYQNLTYKHVMVLKYVKYHCSNVEYVLKVDDDAFVNMPNFVDFIHDYSVKFPGSTDIICAPLYGATVLRKGKWAVSNEYYSGKTYPTYCLGYSLVYPIRTVEKLYFAAQSAPYFWIDDVHITGILPNKLGIKHKNIRPLIININIQKSIFNKTYQNELFPFIFAFINVSPNNMRTIWEYVMKHTPKTNILDYVT